MNTEPKSIDLEALSQLLDLDIAADAARPQKEIDDELKRRGLNPDELNRNAIEALRNALKSKNVSNVATQNIAQRLADAAGEIATAGIKWYRDLLFFEPQFAAGGNLAGNALVEADKSREVVLAKEFTESELSHIPWAGPKLKLSKTIDAEKRTAIYHAFVTSINKQTSQTGTLRIALIAPDGQTAEARLKSGDRKKMLQGADLPADSSELRYALLIE
jgi:hypothetical protein